MAKPNSIELPDCDPISILYEDRSVLAIDKPRGWMLVPHSWQKTNRNLMAAIASSIAAGDFWARSRGLKFLRNVHRLDADTSGILLFAKSVGAVDVISELFETRRMEKTYLAVVDGEPRENAWTCELPLAQDPDRYGRMQVDMRNGKPAETRFRVLEAARGRTLIECRPITGRTHQIRLHLAEDRLPIVGDDLYNSARSKEPLGLRAIRLAFLNPFTKRPVDIHASYEPFLKEFGFSAAAGASLFAAPPASRPAPRPASPSPAKPPGPARPPGAPPRTSSPPPPHKAK